jgi:hypothetical protein
MIEGSPRQRISERALRPAGLSPPLEPERPKISGGRSDQQDSCFGDQQEQGGHP